MNENMVGFPEPRLCMHKIVLQLITGRRIQLHVEMSITNEVISKITETKAGSQTNAFVPNSVLG